MSSTRPPWTMRADLSEAPVFVCWETTKACLLSCRHCRARAIRTRMPGELDYQQGLELIDQLVDFGEPYPALLLTGGDPLMRDDIFDLIDYAKSKSIYVALAASVTPKLNETTVSRMKEMGVDIISVSLDGASPETHDKLRGIRGTWQKTIQAMQSAKNAGLRAQINTTVMRSNINELAEIFHIVKQSGSVAWEVFFLIRTGRGASLESLEATECEEVMHFLYDASHYGVPVRTAEGPHFRRIRAERGNGHAPPNGELYRNLMAKLRTLEGEPTNSPSLKSTPTRDGRGILFVTYDGEVYPSGFLPISTGKVPSESLRSIYRSNPLFTALRDSSKLKGRCGVCEYREICGGSRSRAFAEFGDPFEEDPACPYTPHTEELTPTQTTVLS
ncbi:MAG: TIGR04053 family radical SAM/SPASM domain-containing protein [Candidatus Bathyarchaeia archaeon]